jgi:hypothetical protein
MRQPRRALRTTRALRLLIAVATAAVLTAAASGASTATVTSGPAIRTVSLVVQPQTVIVGTMRNAATGRCADDSIAYGLRSFTCNGQNFQMFL